MLSISWLEMEYTSHYAVHSYTQWSNYRHSPGSVLKYVIHWKVCMDTHGYIAYNTKTIGLGSDLSRRIRYIRLLTHPKVVFLFRKPIWITPACTPSFLGTSLTKQHRKKTEGMAWGIVALALEANPKQRLGEDIQHIIVGTLVLGKTIGKDRRLLGLKMDP